MQPTSSKQLKDWIKKMAKDKGVSTNILLQNYMLERLLERIAMSKYKKNFILKGGMLISSLIGIDLRSTLDMDTTIKGITLEEKKLKRVLEEIILIDANDNINFKLLKVKPIMDEADYTGYRITIEGQFYTITQKFKMDISTGDVITPDIARYKYKLMFENRSINIFAYNIETILSEKFESIISKGTANTRARDYYDIFILYKLQKSNTNFKVLKEAIKNTFEKRGTTYDVVLVKRKIMEIKKSKELKNIWDNYRKKFTYARAIEFETIVSIIEEMLKM